MQCRRGAAALHVAAAHDKPGTLSLLLEALASKELESGGSDAHLIAIQLAGARIPGYLKFELVGLVHFCNSDCFERFSQ